MQQCASQIFCKLIFWRIKIKTHLVCARSALRDDVDFFSSLAFFTILPCRKHNLHKNAFILKDEQNLIHLHIVCGSYRIFSDMIPTRLKFYKDHIKATITILFSRSCLIFLLMIILNSSLHLYTKLQATKIIHLIILKLMKRNN